MLSIPLTQGYSTIISDEDADLAEMKWYAMRHRSGTKAARKFGSSRKGFQPCLIHRVIAARMGDIPEGYVIDHINGDTLDNRRENLRAVTVGQNNINITGAYKNSTSGSIGVVPRGARWRAYISLDGRRRWLGHFDTKEQAIAARLAAERDLWGVQPRRAHAHAAA